MAERLGRHIVLGMAGHIDHGKTEIVKALTGTDTDRLKEEKERGMTTDLGFAFLSDDITIIDVPGHEKFVKTMVAGVNTVDLALLVVAADDGVMPQTIEHLEILNLLQISSGLVAVSKIDLVETDWLEMVIEDIQKLLKGTILEGSPIIPVSPITQAGVDDLNEAIFHAARQVRDRRDKGVFRLPIDRVFTIKGFGTVIAGTVLSGKIAPEDTVELLPQGIPLRVRGVQVHGKSMEEGTVGYRAAINLMGIEKEKVDRGDVLAEPGFYRPTSMIDAHFNLLSSSRKDLKNRTRVHVHIGTTEVTARIILLDKQFMNPGDKGFVQIHFEKPVVGDMGDRFVVRSYSPVRTIGGGLILDVHPVKHKPFQTEVLDKLQKLYLGDPGLVVLDHLNRAWFTPQTEEDLTKSMGITKEALRAHLSELEARDDALRIGKKRWMSKENHEILYRKIVAQLELFFQQNPLRLSMSGAELHSRIRQTVDRILFDTVLSDLQQENKLKVSGNQISLTDHSVQLTPELEFLKKDINDKMLADPLNPPSKKELIDQMGKDATKMISFLIESGDLILLQESILFHRTAIEKAKQKIMDFLNKKGETTVSEIKQYLNTTRKYAVPLLIYFDNLGLTERDGDLRRLKE